MADPQREKHEKHGSGGGLDLDERVRLVRSAAGFPAGAEGTVAGVWCAGRVLVELGPFEAPVVVEVDAADVEPAD